MRRVFTIGLFSIFSIMMAGTVMAQERQVLQEGYSGIGTGRIGSGPGGGLDNVWMRNLLASRKPCTAGSGAWTFRARRFMSRPAVEDKAHDKW